MPARFYEAAKLSLRTSTSQINKLICHSGALGPARSLVCSLASPHCHWPVDAGADAELILGTPQNYKRPFTLRRSPPFASSPTDYRKTFQRTALLSTTQHCNQQLFGRLYALLSKQLHSRPPLSLLYPGYSPAADRAYPPSSSSSIFRPPPSFFYIQGIPLQLSEPIPPSFLSSIFRPPSPASISRVSPCSCQSLFTHLSLFYIQGIPLQLTELSALLFLLLYSPLPPSLLPPSAATMQSMIRTRSSRLAAGSPLRGGLQPTKRTRKAKLPPPPATATAATDDAAYTAAARPLSPVAAIADATPITRKRSSFDAETSPTKRHKPSPEAGAAPSSPLRASRKRSSDAGESASKRVRVDPTPGLPGLISPTGILHPVTFMITDEERTILLETLEHLRSGARPVAPVAAAAATTTAAPPVSSTAAAATTAVATTTTTTTTITSSSSSSSSSSTSGGSSGPASAPPKRYKKKVYACKVGFGIPDELLDDSCSDVTDSDEEPSSAHSPPPPPPPPPSQPGRAPTSPPSPPPTRRPCPGPLSLFAPPPAILNHQPVLEEVRAAAAAIPREHLLRFAWPSGHGRQLPIVAE